MKKPKQIWLTALVAISIACQLPFTIMKSVEEPIISEQNHFQIDDLLDLVFSATQTPTPNPVNHLADAETALFSGQLDKAMSLFQSVFDSAIDQNLKAKALYGLGRSYYTKKDFPSAIDAFNRILGQYSQTEVFADAHFMVAESYFEISEYQQAANAYTQYTHLKPGAIDNYSLTLAGDAALNAGNFEQAISSYQAALQANPPGNAGYLNLQTGKAYEGLENYTTAIQYYMNVYDSSSDEYTRSTANLLAGQAYLKLGMEEEAYTRFMDSVIQFPKAFDSFTALSILVNNGVPVNEYYRGLVDYYAKSYKFAIEAFERYLASNPDTNNGSVHYFKGVSHYKLGEPRKAIAEYDQLIANYPANPYWAAAWDEKGFVQWVDLSEFNNAAETYLTFISTNPSAMEAPVYLYEAGRIYERAGNLEKAALAWQRMMDEYPSAELSYRGLFMAGIVYFRLEKFNEALSIFQRYLVLGTGPTDKAKAYLWIGKCHQGLGQQMEAQNAWNLGVATDPTDYYSIRAGELLDGKGHFEIIDNYDLGYDLALEKSEAEAWMISTFNLPPETALDDLGDLEEHIRIKRIRAFHTVGLYSEAIKEAELLRVEVQADAAASFRLMNFLLPLHLYQPAVYICRNILSMTGMDDLTSLTAPIYFTHIRFGAYFRELLVPIANEFGIHPLLMLSLVRQESMFNPFIGSSAGALGLTQIMPETGKENADLLKWPINYDTYDLFLAEVSLTLGAYYLSRMQNYLSGNLQAALAAYNAGPGSAESLLAISKGDPDLFLEIIRTQETQDYLMQIQEFLNIYQLVYSRPQ